MLSLDELHRDWKAFYGIEWTLSGSARRRRPHLEPSRSVGDCMYLDESQIVRFAPGEGPVGKAFEQQKTFVLPSTEDAGADFLRKASALADGIHSIVFLWSEGRILELGFQFHVSEVPSTHIAQTYVDAKETQAVTTHVAQTYVDAKKTQAVTRQSSCSAVAPLVDLRESLKQCFPFLRPQPFDFIPEAHREAFLDRSDRTEKLFKTTRSKQQMPDTEPPAHRVFFDMDEVKRHSRRDDGWIVVHHNVYNITNFIQHHPGWFYGSQSSTAGAIMDALGKDCTDVFDAIHLNRSHTIRQLAEYRIGELMPSV